MSDFVCDLSLRGERVEAADRLAEVERGNLLLEALDREEWSLIEPHLEQASLTKGQVLEESYRPAAFLYFPVKGAVSVEAGYAKVRLQLTLVGREGLIGAHLLIGGTPVSKASVQFEGAAWRISAQALQECLNESPRLHRQLLLGVGSFLDRLSLTSWVHGRGRIEHRLAVWLLTAADCLDTDRITVTHQELSDALGVRRPSVTIALQALEQKRALRSQRGHVRLLDRQRLAVAAGDYLSAGTLGTRAGKLP